MIDRDIPEAEMLKKLPNRAVMPLELTQYVNRSYPDKVDVIRKYSDILGEIEQGDNDVKLIAEKLMMELMFESIGTCVLPTFRNSVCVEAKDSLFQKERDSKVRVFLPEYGFSCDTNLVTLFDLIYYLNSVEVERAGEEFRLARPGIVNDLSSRYSGEARFIPEELAFHDVELGDEGSLMDQYAAECIGEVTSSVINKKMLIELKLIGYTRYCLPKFGNEISIEANFDDKSSVDDDTIVNVTSREYGLSFAARLGDVYGLLKDLRAAEDAVSIDNFQEALPSILGMLRGKYGEGFEKFPSSELQNMCR